MLGLTGQSIGRYHILEQLGEGGMATVYKAYDTRLERNVALKVLRIEIFSPILLQQVLQRFEREAKSLAKLSHPNIVNVLDYGEHEGMPYLVMEYLPGGTLKQKLGQAIPWPEAVRLLMPVADGLSYAHQHGIIHRDVKPANILLKEKGAPVLTDFGIAKLLETSDGQTLTASGVGIGTPEYMAPEQGMGSKNIDARADIYALGIVFYEMVIGRKPYMADTPMAVVLKQISDPLPRPTQFVPDLPESVEHVLFKALAKQPDDRYQTMDEFIAALEGLTRQADTALRIQAEPASQPAPTPAPAETVVTAPSATVIAQPVATVVTPPAEKLPLPAKPNPTLGLWVIGAIFILGIVAVGGWFLRSGLMKASQAAAPVVSTVAPTREILPTATRAAEPTSPPTRTSLPRPTDAPRPTELPGSIVIPIQNMAREIPWLPIDKDAAQGAFWLDFKVNQPPFDNPLVRKAFIAALNREALVEIVREKGTRDNLRLATNLLHPGVLGRDLTGKVGIHFDPDLARRYLAEAGYPDGKDFPSVTVCASASDASVALFTAILQMWQDHLKVSLKVRYIERGAYYTAIYDNPPAIYLYGWVVDRNDPEDIMQLFRSTYERNVMGFANPQFDRLIDQAAQATDPAKRQELYILAERLLCEEEAVIIPLYFFTTKIE